MKEFVSHGSWLLRAWIAFVFVQSLFFKFTGAAESIYIFQTIADWSGLAFFEPVMRYVIGGAELVASILVFTPLYPLGGLLATGIMTGAIFFHLASPLGIEVAGDGGLLFYMACGVWMAGLALAYIGRTHIITLLRTLRGR